MYNNVSADGRILEGNARYTGFCADFMRQMAWLMGFKYVIQPVKDGRYGDLFNGSWNGMVGEIVRRVSLNILFIDVYINLKNQLGPP